MNDEGQPDFPIPPLTHIELTIELMKARPEIVTLCGSTRFKDAFHAENKRLTLSGIIVISLGVYGHTDMPDYDWNTDVINLKPMLDRLHFHKIDLANRIHVIDVNEYIGESTAREIEYARARGKQITYMSDDDDLR
jgi:hypothetical protein